MMRPVIDDRQAISNIFRSTENLLPSKEAMPTEKAISVAVGIPSRGREAIQVKQV